VIDYFLLGSTDRQQDILRDQVPSVMPDIKTRFATLAKKRFPHLPAMASNPSLEEEFARNTEFLRLRLEYEELVRLCRNWLIVSKGKDEAALRPPAYSNVGHHSELETVSTCQSISRSISLFG
jgi:hypothetical protein